MYNMYAMDLDYMCDRDAAGILLGKVLSHLPQVLSLKPGRRQRIIL